MAKSLISKMEEAAGITIPIPKMPYAKGESIPQGGVARPFTGPRPWSEKKKASEPASGTYEHNSPAKPL